MRVSGPRPSSWWTLPVLASLALCAPMLLQGSLAVGSDVGFAAQMTQGMVDGWSDGHLYPRWVDSMSRGFGGAAFVFYPPLGYFVSGLFTLATGDVALGLMWSVLFGTLLSGLAFHHAVRPDHSPRIAAMAAALYVLLPYRSIDLYDRFAYAELFAFVFIPLVFRYLRELVEKPGPRPLALLALSSAGLILTHLLTAYMLLFALGPYALWLLWRRPDDTTPLLRLAWLTAAASTALALSAIFLLPLWSERPAVHSEYIVQGLFGQWPRNFAFRDEVAFGFQRAPIKPAINLSVACHAAILCVGGLVAFLSKRGRERSESLTLAGVGAWVTLLQLPLSAPIWHLTPFLEYLQFPWRFGSMQSLVAALLVARTLQMLHQAVQEHEGEGEPTLPHRGPLGVALLATVGVSFLATMSMVGAKPFGFGHEMATSPEIQSRVLFEYTPRQASGFGDLPRLPASPRHFATLDDASRAAGGSVGVIAWRSHRRELIVDAPGASTLQVTTFVHPGWRVRVDGEPVPHRGEPPFGAITVDLPPGEHRVALDFGDTPARVLGRRLSGAALLGVALALAHTAWRRRADQRRLPPATGRSEAS